MKIAYGKSIYKPYKYEKEEELERNVVDHSTEIFGSNSIYCDFKKRIGKHRKEGSTVPDGYLIDLRLHTNPRLYFVEVEREDHSLYEHIGPQILKFSTVFDENKYDLKEKLMEYIKNNARYEKLLKQYFENSTFSNVSELLDYLLYKIGISVIVVIDKITDDIRRACSKFSFPVDLLQFETYVDKDGNYIHRFDSLTEDLEEAGIPESEDPDEIDTIVVPAKKDGFNEVFIGKNCWYAIRISSIMLDRIKYIAAYQTAPVSAITHCASVKSIEKLDDGSGKYIVYFSEKATQIRAIPLGNQGKKGIAPQAPRYTTYARLKNAKSIIELWSE